MLHIATVIFFLISLLFHPCEGHFPELITCKRKWKFASELGPDSIFRIQKATESLRTFQPSADPCFDEFVLDTSREETLLKEICFGGGTSKYISVI